MVLFGIPQFRSEIQASNNNEVTTEFYGGHIIYLINYPLVVVVFLLNCVADKPPLETNFIKPNVSNHQFLKCFTDLCIISFQNPSPEITAGFLSSLVYSWFDKLAWKGFKKPLEHSDLWDINPEDTSSEITPIFEKHWQKSLQKSCG